MSDDFEFRNGEDKDAPELVKMLIELERHMAKTNPNYWLRSEDVLEKTMLNRCKEYLGDKNTKVSIAISPNSNKLVGMAIGVVEYHKDSPVQIVGNIHNIWVDTKYRSRNVGKKLVADLVSFFKERKVEELLLDYSHGNIEAEMFWKKLGYTPSIILCSNTIENLESKIHY